MSARGPFPSAHCRAGRKRRLAGIVLLVLAGGLGACGDGEPIDIIEAPGTGTPAPAPTATPEPLPEPTDFKVAYINLMSPVSLDRTNTVPSDTYDQRLAQVIEELKAYKPDLVAFSEVTETKEHGRAASVLARELKMEPLYVRAQPWYVGVSKEQNDTLVKTLGFEEGELILVNGARFPNVEGEQKWLNPRTSESTVAAGLWVRLKGPEAIGGIDVFVSHLSGTDARVRTQQAVDFASFIKSKRGTGPAIVLGDMGDGPETPTHQVFLDLGLIDLFEDTPIGTCCRDSVLGEPAPPQVRSDFIFSSGWRPAAISVFADRPKKLPDGTLVFASDHNGIRAEFAIGAPATP